MVSQIVLYCSSTAQVVAPVENRHRSHHSSWKINSRVAITAKSTVQNPVAYLLFLWPNVYLENLATHPELVEL